MYKDKIIDFDDELRKASSEINDSAKLTKAVMHDVRDTQEEIAHLTKEVEDLSNCIGTQLPNVSTDSTLNSSIVLSWDDSLFLHSNPLLWETRIREEVLRRPQLLPSLTGVDYAVTAIAAAAAVAIDFLVVKIPKDVNYMNKFQQEGSEFTSWFRSLGVDEKGKLQPFFRWMEKTCKVPYDKVNGTDIDGFGSRTHRMLSLGHDPLFGLIFGVIDILNGQMSVIDRTGLLRVVKTYTPGSTEMVFAPLLWLGHIVSDVCTSVGIPIPGWGLTQLLQFGSFGPKNRTIADLSTYMYTQGYDLRHLVTMAISTAVIEIIVRAYHYLSVVRPLKQKAQGVAVPISSVELEQIQSRLKLHKMLFLAHSCAAGGNAIKVFAHQGNPLAINLPQWGLFLKESVVVLKAVTRDTTGEKVIRNRRVIDSKWNEITSIQLSELPYEPGFTSIYGDLASNVPIS